MLQPLLIKRYYENAPLQHKILSSWCWSRKHFRIQTINHKFIKLNHFKNRINLNKLRGYCIKYTPQHVYFSILDWLFPESVGKKYKANHALPIGGEYVVDVDAYVLPSSHPHNGVNVCHECLETSRQLTIQLCEKIEEYYSNIIIVFSGRRGFHIHVLDFNIRDWTHYNEKKPIKSHEVARFKFSRTLALETLVFDRHHFTLSTDPMRIISVPCSLNAESGLICTPIGNRKKLAMLKIQNIVEQSKPTPYIYPIKFENASYFESYPEPLRR